MSTTENGAGAPMEPAPKQDDPRQGETSGFKGLPWYVVSRIGAAVIAFGTIVLFTRALGPAEYGLYSIMLGAGLLMSTLLFGWIHYSYVRFYDATGPEHLSGGPAYGMVAAATALFAIAILICWLVLPGQIGLIALVSGLYAATWSLMEVSTAGVRVRRQPRTYAIAVLGRALMATTLGVAFALTGGGGVGALLGAVVASLVVGLALAPSNLGKGGRLSLPTRQALREYANFGMPLALTATGAVLITLVLRLVIVAQLDLEAAGYYSAAENLCQRSIRTLMLAVNMGISVEIYRAYEQYGLKATHETLLRYASFLIVSSVPLFAMLTFASDLVANVALGAEFGPVVADLLPWIAFGAVLGGFQATYWAFSFLLIKRTWPQIVILAFMLLVSAALMWVLLPILGILGAAIATSVAWVLSSAAYAFFGWRTLPIPMPWHALSRMALALLPAIPVMMFANGLENRLIGLVVLGFSMLVFAAGLWIFNYPEVRHQSRKILRRFGISRRGAHRPVT